MPEKNLYKVTFFNQGEVYEIFAKQVYQGDLYGFVIVEEIVFGERSAIVIDPVEEKLMNEFEGVNRSFIPMHEIIRIDQVKKRGTAKITAASESASGKVSKLYTPDNK